MRVIHKIVEKTSATWCLIFGYVSVGLMLSMLAGLCVLTAGMLNSFGAEKLPSNNVMFWIWIIFGGALSILLYTGDIDDFKYRKIEHEILR